MMIDARPPGLAIIPLSNNQGCHFPERINSPTIPGKFAIKNEKTIRTN
jgi:hypothetical protein